MAWSGEGLAFNVHVDGKQQPVWCREGRLEDSDGLQVWIDTRATLNIHRASRYCHRFAFLPAGGGHGHTAPVADQLLINRARENARPIRPRELQVAAKITKTGYRLAAFVPADAPRRLRSPPASSNRLHLRHLRPRTRPANVRHRSGVSIRRRPDLLGGAGTGRKLNRKRLERFSKVPSAYGLARRLRFSSAAFSCETANYHTLPQTANSASATLPSSNFLPHIVSSAILPPVCSGKPSIRPLSTLGVPRAR